VCNLVVRFKYVVHVFSHWELLYNVVVMSVRLYEKKINQAQGYVRFYVQGRWVDGRHKVYYIEDYNGVVVYAIAKNENEAIEKIKNFIDHLKKKLG